MSSRTAGSSPAGPSPFERGYTAGTEAAQDGESSTPRSAASSTADSDAHREEIASAASEAPSAAGVPQAAQRPGVDVRWIVALFVIGIALMVGSALIYKAGWLAQGSGDYAVDSYGEVYSAQIGRTLDDIVYEDFLFTVNPYLFALGAATVIGTLFVLATRGIRRRGE